MVRGKIKNQQAALAVTALFIGAVSAHAQDVDSPVTAGLTLSSRIEVDTNLGLEAVSPGTVITASEGLSFSLRSETATQFLELSADTGFSYSNTFGGGSSTSLDTPTMRLHYSRDGSDSNLTFDADYWTGEVTSAFDIDSSDAVFIIVDTGTLARAGASFAYNWGLNAPLGFSVNASYDMRDYEGTTDPALFDNTTTEVGISANARISAVTEASLSMTLTHYISSDAFATSSDTTRYQLDIEHEIASALTLSGNIGYEDVSTTASGGTTLSDSIFAGVDLSQSLPNGSIFGGVQFDDIGPATSTSLTFGRSLELPRGSLTASVTADWSAGSSAQVLGEAEYEQQFSDGTFTLNLSQSLGTDTLSQDIKYSTLAIAYSKELNSSSDLNLVLNVSRSEDGGAGAADTLNRASVSASYSQELTPDWDLSVGYTHRQNSGSAIATADSDSVFLSLTRDIQFGF